MKSVMFSDSWFDRFKESINSNEDYAKWAADWEGDVVLSIRGDEHSSFFRIGELKNVRLGLFHGKCNSISFPSTIDRKEMPFVLEGKATTWENVLSGRTNVVTAMLKGEISVTGDVRKLMKYVNAAQELVKSAARIE